MSRRTVTIRQIAKEAAVSPTTVSRVVNGDYSSVSESTKQRILEIVEQHSYQPSRREKAQERTLQGVIGVVLPSTEPFFIDVAVALQNALDEVSLEMNIRCSRDEFQVEKENIERLLRAGVAGILYMSTARSPSDCYGQLNEGNVPYVVLDSYLQEYNVPAAVFVDGGKGMYDVTKYLIANGHRSIAYLSGISYETFSHNRYQGYSRALLEEGIAVDPAIIQFGSFTFSSGQVCMRNLLEGGREITAVICENDLIAAGALDVVINSGRRVPDDISLTGFDNSLIAQVTTPKLTSVEQPLGDIARTAVGLLVAQINKEKFENKIVAFAPRIIVRDSVLDLKKSGA